MTTSTHLKMTHKLQTAPGLLGSGRISGTVSIEKFSTKYSATRMTTILNRIFWEVFNSLNLMIDSKNHTISDRRGIYISRYSSRSEAFASELQERLEIMFPCYYR